MHDRTISLTFNMQSFITAYYREILYNFLTTLSQTFLVLRTNNEIHKKRNCIYVYKSYARFYVFYACKL